MFSGINLFWIVLVGSAFLMLVGFGLRERNLGVSLMGIGLLGAMGSVLYKVYITFGV